MTRRLWLIRSSRPDFIFKAAGDLSGVSPVKTQAGEEIRVVGLKEVSDMQLLMKVTGGIAAFPLDRKSGRRFTGCL